MNSVFLQKTTLEINSLEHKYLENNLIKLLCNHNWDYDNLSDDRLWRINHQNYNKIVYLCRQLHPDIVKDIWDKYAPKEYKCPIKLNCME